MGEDVSAGTDEGEEGGEEPAPAGPSYWTPVGGFPEGTESMAAPPPMVDPATTNDKRSRKVWISLVALVVVVMAVAGVVAMRDTTLTADEALDRASAYFAEATTFEFTLETTNEYSDSDDGGGPGSTTTDRTVGGGVVSMPHRWHQHDDDGFGEYEAIRFDEDIYYRYAEDDGSLADEQWVKESASGMSTIEQLAFGSESWVDMTEIDEALADLHDATVLDRQPDRITVGADIELSEEEMMAQMGVTEEDLEEFGDDISNYMPDEASIELEMTTDGKPLQFVFASKSVGSSFEAVMRFVSWDEPVTIEEPAADTIDPTPWLDEDGLAEVREVVDALAPTAPPPGWQLTSIEGVIEEWDDELSCPTLYLGYGLADRDDEADNEDYLSVSLTTRECADEMGAGDDFELGDFGPVPTRSSTGSIELLYGETVVTVDSSLGDEVVAAMIATITTLDVDAALAQVGPRMEADWTDYGSYGYWD